MEIRTQPAQHQEGAFAIILNSLLFALCSDTDTTNTGAAYSDVSVAAFCFGRLEYR